MTSHRLRATEPAPATIREDFARLRRELGVPDAFPEPVLDAAAEAARAGPPPAKRDDLRDVDFFTVDPPGSMDLDQAMQLERRDGGFRVRYAIADLAAFVPRGGPVEAEAWARGVTVYAPDGRAPLYPPVLGEGAASLLPDEERPAVCFLLDLDARGELRAVSVVRALVRSRERLDYAHLGRHEELLREIGEARERLERERGGVRLESPAQAVVPDPQAPCGYRLELERRLPSEDWNAQISLLAGMAAAGLMLRAGCGLLRTMDGAAAAQVEALRRSAAALGVPWPAGEPLSQLAPRLHEDDPREAALIRQARGVMGGARYTPLDGQRDPATLRHAALAAAYAHTTAPLRRLADRYVLDLLVEISAGAVPGDEEQRTLAALAPVMGRAEQRADALERAVVDELETRLLESRVGESFPAVVVDHDRRGAAIQIAAPPVRAHLAGEPPRLGATVAVTLMRADPRSRSLEFRLAAPQ
jgi:exoribonuclease R